MRSTRLIALTLACAIVSSLPFLFSNAALAAAPKPPAKTSTSSGSLDKLDTDTSKITAAEGTTATAIRGATAQQPAPPTMMGLVQLHGSFSPASENVNNEPDPAFVAPKIFAGTVAALSVGVNRMLLKDIPQAQQIVESAANILSQKTINVALLGQHKYMLADCLGVKVSAGQFTLKLANPTVAIVDESVVVQFRINLVSFSAFSLRFRPDVTDLIHPCHFSGRVEVGGEASNIVVSLRCDPSIDIEKCRVAQAGGMFLHLDIGNVNLKPVPNDLDKVLKDMIEDAFNSTFDAESNSVGLDAATGNLAPMLLNEFNRAVNQALAANCPFAGSEVGNKAATAVESASARATNAASSASGPKPLSPVDSLAGSSPAILPPDGVTAASAASGPKPFSPVDGVVGSSPAPPATGRAGAFDIVANAELKGRLGHIVIAFPDGAKIREARIDSFKSGDANRIRTDYGNTTIELLPGTYDLVIDGRKVTGIPVQSHHDTRLHVGVLRLHGGKDTRFDFFEPGGQERLHTYYGETDVGLPAGDVEILINGQREKVTIEDGVIADF